MFLTFYCVHLSDHITDTLVEMFQIKLQPTNYAYLGHEIQIIRSDSNLNSLKEPIFHNDPYGRTIP